MSQAHEHIETLSEEIEEQGNLHTKFTELEIKALGDSERVTDAYSKEIEELEDKRNSAIAVAVGAAIALLLIGIVFATTGAPPATVFAILGSTLGAVIIGSGIVAKTYNSYKTKAEQSRDNKIEDIKKNLKLLKGSAHDISQDHKVAKNLDREEKLNSSLEAKIKELTNSRKAELEKMWGPDVAIVAGNYIEEQITENIDKIRNHYKTNRSLSEAIKTSSIYRKIYDNSVIFKSVAGRLGDDKVSDMLLKFEKQKKGLEAVSKTNTIGGTAVGDDTDDSGKSLYKDKQESNDVAQVKNGFIPTDKGVLNVKVEKTAIINDENVYGPAFKPIQSAVFGKNKGKG